MDRPDIIFEAEGHQMKCNRKVLMSKSTYLEEYLTENEPTSKVCISNVPHSACETVIKWMHEEGDLNEAIPESQDCKTTQKVWELSLRFAVVQITEHCSKILVKFITHESVCDYLSSIFRYTKQCSGTPPSLIESAVELLKRNCFGYLSKYHSEIQKTPPYFAMMTSKNYRLRQAVEEMTNNTNTETPKGMAALLHKLKEQPVQPLPQTSVLRSHSVGQETTFLDSDIITPAVDDPVYEASLNSRSDVFQKGDGEGRSPIPQPAALLQSDLEDVGLLIVKNNNIPLPPNVRLATCVEAHTNRVILKDLMDSVDGGFLSSFQLQDGKVDGPGFGVPLRFTTGKFPTCSMRIIVKPDEYKLNKLPASPIPASQRSVTELSNSTVGNISAATPEQPKKISTAYDTERDSLLLKHCKLQQEVRVTAHELEMFKCDFQDWETSLNETNALREVEEQRLKQRIVQQKRQLLRTVYGHTIDSESPISDSKRQRERDQFRKLTDNIDSQEDGEQLLQIKKMCSELELEISGLRDVEKLIKSELSENIQYDEYGKRYISAVSGAQIELSGLIQNNNFNNGLLSLSDIKNQIKHDRDQSESENSSLSVINKKLRSRIENECSQITRIQMFLNPQLPVPIP